MLPTRLRTPLFALVVTLLLAPPVRAQAPDAVPLDALGSLPSHSRTGVLYDRVLPLAGLERLDGSAAAPVITAATWRQAWDELRRASLVPGPGPGLSAVNDDARAALREGVIPLAILDRAFERVAPGSPVSDALAGRASLLASRAFAATALAPHTYRGGDLRFRLDSRAYFSDDGRPRTIEFDFADGLGFRRLVLDQAVRVHYATAGTRTLTARVTRGDGSVALSRFRFDVERIMAPLPDDTLHVTATTPYLGNFGTGDAYVALAPGHVALANPVVVIEGMDFYNDMNWDELYALLNQENLLETLRGEGFDVVVLDFTDATVAIQQNGFVVAELIQQVQNMIDPSATLAVVGASMGAVCSRYALAWMETQNLPHRVRTWISFDGPHGGADIPLGLQYWIHFFAGQSADAATFDAILQRPAARQLLFHHYTVPQGATGVPDPLRATLLSDLAAVGWPTKPRTVAIANGSETGQTQGFVPAAQLIRWEYTSGLVDITGDIWAVPSASDTVFRGRTRILFSTTTQNVIVNGTTPWDGAPGGSRASMAELDAVAAPYGDIVALHPSHCFVPTVSALALATTDPFFDIANTPNLLSLTTFDALYKPVANQEHVEITAENASWVRSEIEQGVLDAPAPDAGPLRLRAVPNPFANASRFSFTLPRPGPVTVRVFGVDGRQAATLLDGPRAAGAHSVGWDGRDAHGTRVPAGVYFVRVTSPDRTQMLKIVRLD
jgi:hypothetical protein